MNKKIITVALIFSLILVGCPNKKENKVVNVSNFGE